MAKAGFSLGFEPYDRRDPVTGETKTWMRKDHSRQSSKRLKDYQACVAQGMRGKTFRSGNAKKDSQEIRQYFAQVAHQCSGR